MFSATLSSATEQLAQQYLTKPKRIAVTSALQPAPQITQDVLHAVNGEKMPLLLEQLHAQEGSILIFVKTKRRAKDLALKLASHHHRVGAIHGDLHQSKRTRIMNDFRRANSRIMVATDIAARGLDVPHINLVINYDLPVCPEDYVHRIGRTGRAGAMGRALSFIGPEDRSKWKAITRLIDPDAKQSDYSSHPKGKKAASPHKGTPPGFRKKATPHKRADSEGQKSSFAQKKQWTKKAPNRRTVSGKPNRFSKARA